MVLEEVTRIIANVIIISAIIPLCLFIYYYGSEPVPGTRRRRYSKRWKSTSMGKVLMSQKILWVAMVIFVVTSVLLEYFFEQFVRIFFYTALVSMFWIAFFVLRHVQGNAPISTDDGRSGVADEHHPRPVATVPVTPDVDTEQEGK